MISRTILALAAAGLFTVAAPLTATVAVAQEMGDEMQMQSPAMPSAADFSAEQVDAFAVAYIQVAQIGMSFDQQIQAAGSEEEQQQLQQQAQGEMMTVIEGVEGISIEDYNGIFVVAQNDVQFANQVQAAINEIAGAAGGGAGGGAAPAEPADPGMGM